MRDCCNTTLHTLAHGFKQLGAWLSASTIKVVNAAKPHLKQLGETMRLAGVIAWSHTRTFFVAHKKELALVALGAGIVGLAIGLVKMIQFCCKRDAANDIDGDEEFDDSTFVPPQTDVDTDPNTVAVDL